MQHSQSPLTMLEHRFTHFECTATDGDSLDGALSLDTDTEIHCDTEDPLRWKVALRVSFQNSDDKNPSSYSGAIAIYGEFKIRESFEEANREALIRVTATSMLYGACREMLANFTSRSTNGMLDLPSVSFRKSKEESEKK
jgi:preprotein translocase subunit SecB